MNNSSGLLALQGLTANVYSGVLAARKVPE
jgi:hypothetical protein